MRGIGAWVLGAATLCSPVRALASPGCLVCASPLSPLAYPSEGLPLLGTGRLVLTGAGAPADGESRASALWLDALVGLPLNTALRLSCPMVVRDGEVRAGSPVVALSSY